MVRLAKGLAQLNWNPSTHTLRNFGFIALVVFQAWAAGAYLEVGPLASLSQTPALIGGLVVAGLLCGVFSLLAPTFNRPLYVGLSIVTFPIGLVVSHVVLAVIFYGVITPIGSLRRLLRQDEIRRARQEHRSESNWVSLEPAKRDSYFRQF